MRVRGAKIVILAAAFLAVVFSCPALAQVSGPCANCHTMHNSQDGGAVYQGTAPIINHRSLLTKDCVGCHSATDGSTWKDPVTGAPIVYNAAEPTYGADAGDGKNQGLAAGNFYWVDQDDTFGHNIFSSDSAHTIAPGYTQHGCIGYDSCHQNLDRVYTYPNEHVGKYACTKCHMIDWRKRNWHHSDDTGSDLILTREQGWYRFLSSHNENKGLRGIEDPDWEYTVSGSDHNEYLGYDSDKTNDRAGISHYTTTAFCTGCHNAIHIQSETSQGGDWLRHPSDEKIPASGEYAGYTEYDPLTPVARPALTAVSSVVTPGADMVMCLSCHRAHGSPYPDMLRFDYTQMQAGGGGADGTGCFKCHTGKDGS